MTLMQRMRTQGLLALLGLLLAPSAWADVVEYIHTDALGSPVAVTNQAAQVVERTTYDPYGTTIGRANNDRQGYTGHVMDSATGLTYMQQRYYDPTIGRFLSVDPVSADVKTGGNFNRYKYAANNPYRFVDPDGRYDCQASKSQCQQFDRGVALINKALSNSRGDAKTLLTGIVKTLGTKNDGNGIVIKDTPENSGSWDGGAKGGILNVNFSLLNSVSVSLGQKGQDFMVASTTVHEGWHAQWEKLG